MRVYVASSWRNERQPEVVAALRAADYEVYDFRHSGYHDTGFHWSEIDSHWKEWTPEQFRASLIHPIAQRGYKTDFEALRNCDACVLVMPCGRSAHLELGWAAGNGKFTGILLADGEPELMYSMVDFLSANMEELLEDLQMYES